MDRYRLPVSTPPIPDIEGGGVVQVLPLEATPNRSAGAFSVSFSLSEPSQVNLEVYDLSGRLVQRLLSEEVLSGQHSTVWSPGESITTGCYLIWLVTSEGTATENCVHLR
jgi:flagellar hook assembly protein FlgD